MTLKEDTFIFFTRTVQYRPTDNQIIVNVSFENPVDLILFGGTANEFRFTVRQPKY